MTKEQALKPCAHCGGEATLTHVGMNAGAVVILCLNERCKVRPHTDPLSLAEAIAAWNTRSPTIQLDQGLVERLEGIGAVENPTFPRGLIIPVPLDTYHDILAALTHAPITEPVTCPRAERLHGPLNYCPDCPGGGECELPITGDMPISEVGGDWLLRQLEAWPTRVDPERTTNIEYLMKAAAKRIASLPDGVSIRRDALEEAAKVAERLFIGEDGMVSSKVMERHRAAKQCAAAIRSLQGTDGVSNCKPALPSVVGDDVERLWLWRNFVDGRPEYWAFDNPYPCHENGDPVTLGSPCGWALLKPSENGRPDVSEGEVEQEIARAMPSPAQVSRDEP